MDVDVVKRRDANGIRQRRAKVCFSYEPQHEDELALKVGDEVVVHGEDEEGWYQATVNGRTGVCPSNFVELLPDLLPDMAKSSSADSPKDNKELKEKLNNTLSRSKDTDSLKRQSLHDPLAVAPTNPPTPTSENRPPLEDSKGEKAAKKVQGVGFGDIFAGGQVKLKSAAKSNGEEKIIGPAESKRPASTLIPSSADHKEKTDGGKKEKENDKEHVEPKLEYAKADYDYTAASGDELSFKTGDIMRIISKECEDEGWWRGELNGLTGVFPDNFCTVIPLSEVPAPKRPARPSATDKSGPTSGKKEVAKEVPIPTKDVKHEERTSGKSIDKPIEKAAKPDRPDKPTAKPAVGKKPTSGTGTISKSREGSVELVDSGEKSKEDSKKHESGGKEEGREKSGSVRMRHNGHTGSIHGGGLVTTPESTRSEKAVGFDNVHVGEKLNHMTRAKGPQRRPPSMILIRPNSEDDGKLVANGVDGGEESVGVMAKDDGTTAEKASASGLTKKDSFLKHLDTTLGARPRSPALSRPASDSIVSPPSPSPAAGEGEGGSLQEEVKHLREQIRLLREDFALQLQDLKDLLKEQAERTSMLEKELDRSRSSSHASISPRP